MKKLTLIPLILLVCLHEFCCTQTTAYEFGHITAEDGLSSLSATCIFKDSHGFIWIGTENGLNRFDGYNMVVFQTIFNEHNSLSDNHVTAINESDEGHLLVGTATGGLNIYDPATGDFIRYAHDPGNNNSISSDEINTIYKDPEGIVWIGTNSGLNRLTPGLNTFDLLRQNPNNPGDKTDKIYSLCRDSKARFWIGTGSGLFLLEPGTGEFSAAAVDPPYDFLTESFEIRCISEDPAGDLWFGTNRGVFKYQNNDFIYLGPPDVLINRMVEDIEMVTVGNQHYAWISTHAGLYKYDIGNDRFESFFSRPGDARSISNQATLDLLYDHEGLLWIATMNMGVDVMKVHESPFKHHLISGVPEDPYHYSASTFFEDGNGTLWMGSHAAGLLKYDQDLNRISKYELIFSDHTEYVNGRVRSIHRDMHQNLWVGAGIPKQSICILQEEKRVFRLIPFDTVSILDHGLLLPNHVTDMAEDDRGGILMGFPSGLYWVPDSIRGTPIISPFPHEGLAVAPINDLYTGMQGRVWIASDSGLFLMHTAHHGPIQITRQAYCDTCRKDEVPVPLCIFAASDGTVWVGTDKGLCMVKKNEYVPLQSDNGLIRSNAIYSITEDGSGHLWLGTEKGLVRYHNDYDEKRQAKRFKTSDGLPYEGSIKAPLFRSRSGRIFVGSIFGTQNGFYCFHPDSIIVNRNIPPVVLTDFRVYNKPHELDSSISEIKQLILRHNENYFSFDFAALNFFNSSENQYMYKLEGFDEDWVFSENRRFANYTGVPPGTYEFFVKGSNNDGFWNEQGTSVTITIHPPPWKTWWAYLLYLVFFVSMLFLVVRYYTRRQWLIHKLELEQVQIEKLEELDKLKTRFFANISHEFRTPLTLILGPLKKLRYAVTDTDTVRDVDIIQRNAWRLQNLINQLLSLSKLESGKMKISVVEVTLDERVKGYVQQFESLAEQRQIKLSFTSGTSNLKVWIDKDKFDKILNNLLSNAFKHTPAGGVISIDIAPGGSLPDKVRITVTNTGPGIEAERLPHIFDRFYQVDESSEMNQEGSGIGLALAKELVELHHGEISVESEVGGSTRFTVLIPLGKGHFHEDEFAAEKTSDALREAPASEPVPAGFFPAEEKEGKSEIPGPVRNGRDPFPLLLIVEDNAELLDFICGFFDGTYRIARASNGWEGLEKANEQIPDLIISDIMMPKMDGFEFCKRIKTEERTSHIPFIMLTARATKESRITGMETGADDFIVKPFDGDELMARVVNLLEQRKRLSEVVERRLRRDQLFGEHAAEDGMIASMEEQFLKKACSIVSARHDDPEFNVAEFSREMHMSRDQLHRKLKAVTRHSGGEFIRMYRLNRAAQLIAKKSASIAEIAYDVGFNSPSYFSECFRNQFGVAPSEYTGEKQ